MSAQYHKIQTLWKREQDKPCNIIPGEFSTPELRALYTAPIWEATEKVDGTNIRVIYDPRQYGGRLVLGKSDRAQTPDFLRLAIEEITGVDRFEKAFADIAEKQDAVVTLYGEGYGSKIQKGGGNYKADGQSFVLFDVLVQPIEPIHNSDLRELPIFLQREDVYDVAHNMGLEAVPVLLEGATLAELEESVAEGFPSDWGDFQAEGVVARTQPELKDRRGRRIITKLKTKDYEALRRADA